MKAIVFEMSDCGVWYARMHLPPNDFRAFEQTGRCAIRTHFAQTIWFPISAVAVMRCDDRVMHGIVIGVKTGKAVSTIEVRFKAIDEHGFDRIRRGDFLYINGN